MWRGIQAAIPGGTLDLPGAPGGPSFEPDTWSLAVDQAIVDDAIRVGGSTRLLAHSYGGLLALRAALDRPEVTTIVAHEPVGWPLLTTLGSAVDQTLLGDRARVDRILDPANAGTPRWLEDFLDFWSGPGTWRRMPLARRERLLALGVKPFLEVRAAFDDPTPVDRWRTLDRPILLTVGEEAHPGERRVLELWTDLLPNASLVVVPGGHLAPITHADAVAAVWRRWLAETAVPR
jgi:pimeloyl-ACP methyl ester carboxylesterase